MCQVTLLGNTLPITLSQKYKQSTNKLKNVYFNELNYLYFLFYIDNTLNIKIKFIVLIKNVKLIIKHMLKKIKFQKYL